MRNGLPWVQHVNLDVIHGKLVGRRVCKLSDGRFDGAVDGESCHGLFSRDGRNVDDLSALSALCQVPADELGQNVYSMVMDLNDLLREMSAEVLFMLGACLEMLV